LKKISASKKAVIIVGARQVGKTTLLREIDFVEEKDGTFSAFKFKINPATKVRFSKTFTNSYELKISELISP
jgi:predicted AAA+ superfamily ATPase